jgi:hypothetical protein
VLTRFRPEDTLILHCILFQALASRFSTSMAMEISFRLRPAKVVNLLDACRDGSKVRVFHGRQGMSIWNSFLRRCVGYCPGGLSQTSIQSNLNFHPLQRRAETGFMNEERLAFAIRLQMGYALYICGGRVIRQIGSIGTHSHSSLCLCSISHMTLSQVGRRAL